MRDIFTARRCDYRAKAQQDGSCNPWAVGPTIGRGTKNLGALGWTETESHTTELWSTMLVRHIFAFAALTGFFPPSFYDSGPEWRLEIVRHSVQILQRETQRITPGHQFVVALCQGFPCSNPQLMQGRLNEFG